MHFIFVFYKKINALQFLSICLLIFYQIFMSCETSINYMMHWDVNVYGEGALRSIIFLKISCCETWLSKYDWYHSMSVWHHTLRDLRLITYRTCNPMFGNLAQCTISYIYINTMTITQLHWYLLQKQIFFPKPQNNPNYLLLVDIVFLNFPWSLLYSFIQQ